MNELNLCEDTPTPVTQNSPRTAKVIMARLFEIRAAQSLLTAEAKKLEEEAELLDAELLRQMDEQGMTRVSAKDIGTAIRDEVEVPVIDDWDAFYQYLKDNDALYLLHKRVSAPAWRELHEAGLTPPGTHAFKKVSLHLRGT